MNPSSIVVFKAFLERLYSSRLLTMAKSTISCGVMCEFRRIKAMTAEMLLETVWLSDFSVSDAISRERTTALSSTWPNGTRLIVMFCSWYIISNAIGARGLTIGCRYLVTLLFKSAANLLMGLTTLRTVGYTFPFTEMKTFAASLMRGRWVFSSLL